MGIKDFEKLVRTENTARRYFKKLVWKNYHVFCTRCHSKKVYILADKKYRCKSCHYTFHDFSDRWLNQVKLSFRNWLWVIKLFELELSTRKISNQLRISYPTILKATHVLRKAILFHYRRDNELLKGIIEMDESYFGGKRKGNRGRGAAGKVPVFGILERDGIVKVEVVNDVSSETLLGLTVKTVRRGSIVYTDKFRSYDALMCCGYKHLKVDHGKRFASGKVYINGLEGFWSFAKERIIKFHGVSKEKFPFYLKEMEFRFNHRHESIFHLLSSYVTKSVQDLL